MNNRDAIEQLLPLKEAKFTEGSCTFPMISTPLQVEALNLAIKALEKIDLIKFNIYALNELLREVDNEHRD